MALFSKSMVELAKLFGGKTADEVEADFDWFMGNNGTVRGLRDGKLVTVPAGSVNTNPTDAQVRHATQGATLSMFCTCLGDDEAVENYKEAKLWVAMRQMMTDNGVAPTAPIVRLIDPARHLPFNMKVAARHCGPCVEDFRYMQDWKYDGNLPEYDGRKKLLVFGTPSIAPDSTRCTMSEQTDLLKDMSKKIGIPRIVHGSAALGTLVSLSHFHETGGELNGQRLPAKNIFARTSTKSVGYRLGLGWGDDGRLVCDHWVWYDDVGRHDALGCFALGVVELGH